MSIHMWAKTKYPHQRICYGADKDSMIPLHCKKLGNLLFPHTVACRAPLLCCRESVFQICFWVLVLILVLDYNGFIERIGMVAGALTCLSLWLLTVTWLHLSSLEFRIRIIGWLILRHRHFVCFIIVHNKIFNSYMSPPNSNYNYNYN